MTENFDSHLRREKNVRTKYKKHYQSQIAKKTGKFGKTCALQIEQIEDENRRQLEETRDETTKYHSQVYHLCYNTVLNNIFKRVPSLIPVIEALNIVTIEGIPIDVDEDEDVVDAEINHTVNHTDTKDNKDE